MSRRTQRFDVLGTPTIFLRLPAGKARVVSGDDGVVEVHMSGRDSALERFLVEDRGGQIVIEPEGGRGGRVSGIDVEIRLGAGADLHARVASADVTVDTEVASIVVEAGSGDVSAGVVSGDVRIKVASGDVGVASVGGRLDVVAASGDVRVRSVAGDLNVKTASGDIDIAEAAGSVVAHSASGDIEIGRFTGELFQAKTRSGDVRLGVTSGRIFGIDFQSLSGDVRTEFPVGSGEAGGSATARLTVKTMSGDIVLRSTG